MNHACTLFIRAVNGISILNSRFKLVQIHYKDQDVSFEILSSVIGFLFTRVVTSLPVLFYLSCVLKYTVSLIRYLIWIGCVVHRFGSLFRIRLISIQTSSRAIHGAELQEGEVSALLT